MAKSSHKPLPESVNKCHEMIRDLEDRIAFFEKQLFGPRADRPTGLSDQADLLEKGQPQAGAADAGKPGADEADEQAKPAEKRKARPHGKRDLGLDHHLPIVKEIVYDVESEEKWCADCGCDKRYIGDKVSWRLTVVPRRFGRVRITQKQCACGVCQSNVSTGQSPMQLIPGGLATPELIADVILNKFLYHIPLQRQEAMAAAHGVHLPKTTQWSILKLTAEGLGILTALMAQRLRGSSHLSMDETTIPVWAKGKTRTGQMWTMFGGKDAPYVVFNFRTRRTRDMAEELLTGFTGTLKSDGYQVYKSLTQARRLKWAGCWAHVRRKFVVAWERSRDPVAHKAINTIRILYDIEREAKRSTSEERTAIREEKARPVVEEFVSWLASEQLSIRPTSLLGKAVSYALNLGEALKTYLSDAEVAIDNNEVERQIRAVAMGRKNYMFVGNELGGQAAAVFYSLIASAKRHGLNVYDYLVDVIDKLAGWPQRRLAELLPDQWKPTAQAPIIAAPAAAQAATA